MKTENLFLFSAFGVLTLYNFPCQFLFATTQDNYLTTPTENKPKQPTHTIYLLQNKEGVEKPEWIKVGAG